MIASGAINDRYQYTLKRAASISLIKHNAATLRRWVFTVSEPSLPMHVGVLDTLPEFFSSANSQLIETG